MPKQAVLPCAVTEECRQRLCSFLIFLLGIGLVCGPALIAVGVYIRIRIRAKVKLIEGYDFNELPVTLMVVGGVTVVFNLVSAKIGHEISYSWKREKFRHVMLGMVISLCIVDVGLLIGGCMAFVHRHTLTTSFHHGIISAMKKYKDNVELKAEVDMLQMELGCCGSNGYEDWFDIQWVNDEYLNLESPRVQSKMTEGEYLNDDTPFSCCHPRAVRPCIHHDVHDNAAHYRYDFERSYTIHRTGCKHQLMEYFNKRLNIIGGSIMGLFLLQLIALLVAQYLNSSICNAIDRGDPERTAKGWIFEECPIITLIKVIAGNFF